MQNMENMNLSTTEREPLQSQERMSTTGVTTAITRHLLHPSFFICHDRAQPGPFQLNILQLYIWILVVCILKFDLDTSGSDVSLFKVLKLWGAVK